jgi:phosphoribosyl 1,2-cyclic phosphodiesterase
MAGKTGEFKVKFRGVRGSYPVCSAMQMKFGGNTSCVEVMVNERLIVLDAGTGIINLGKDLTVNHLASGTCDDSREPVEVVILFSHAHLDHIQGLPFFKPAYLKNSALRIFGFMVGSRDFESVLGGIISSPTFPLAFTEMPATVSISNIGEGETIILYPDSPIPQVVKGKEKSKIILPEGSIVIDCMKSNAHPKDGVLLYRITCNNRSVVYASDIEGKAGADSELIAFAKNADLLIHDAQYTMEDYLAQPMSKEGYGHSTPEMAIETAKLANVRQLALFHLDPGYSDELLSKMEVKAKGAFKNTVIAYEGLEIDLM